MKDIENILVGVDFSESSEAALVEGLRIAQAAGVVGIGPIVDERAALLVQPVESTKETPPTSSAREFEMPE